MPENTRVAGHSLEWEGAPHNEHGSRIQRAYPMEKGGEGRGKCSCGTLSDVLPSKSARQRWHKDHKAEVVAERQRMAATWKEQS
jgi:hypothetical protein